MESLPAVGSKKELTWDHLLDIFYEKTKLILNKITALCGRWVILTNFTSTCYNLGQNY